MAQLVRQEWVADLSGGGLSRRDRRSGTFEAYCPDFLVGRALPLDVGTAADIADAERAIALLDTEAKTLVDTEALSRLLLRAEAVASSRIEGLEVGVRRLLRAEMAQQTEGRSSDVTATEVLANIDAMAVAVNSTDPGSDITEQAVTEVHRRLLDGTRLSAHAGRWRTEQNWIGGSSYNPFGAVFVPPPAELVPGLMADLIEFCNSDDVPAVAQAAIAHAQFETIHPFADGNGRSGRALIHMIFRRRGLTRHITPPVSLILATRTQSYLDGLTAYRYLGPADSPAAAEGTALWVGRFAAACTRAIEDASGFERHAARAQQQWRDRLGPVRSGSALDLLLHKLFGAPILTVGTAAQLVDRSFPAVSAAVDRLVAAGILRQVTVGRRNRAFESLEVIAACTALERRLASPAGDTRYSPPARPVPRR
ncbi:Fic family protein [Nocardia stercoris]|uniref:Fic family protein n=1 Tax=Nocardia stercoris TaxID=2483361 RepID=A0A3M2LB79_9NOCA|nr:Fic family protein [Nocardia stercoris]RMI33990.1 Fic family protein [Nocardia stercoris]